MASQTIIMGGVEQLQVPSVSVRMECTLDQLLKVFIKAWPPHIAARGPCVFSDWHQCQQL